MQVEEYLKEKRKMMKHGQEELERSSTFVLEVVAREIEHLQESIRQMEEVKSIGVIPEKQEPHLDEIIESCQEKENLLKLWWENTINES